MVAVVVLAGVSAAHAADSWDLMLPPLDAVKQLGPRPLSYEDSIEKLLEGSSLSEWSSARTFGTAEACMTEVKARSAANSAAIADLARRAEEAKRRGDQRMLDIASAMAMHRVRDGSGLCIATNKK